MKILCTRALHLLLLFGILAIPCLLSVTGGQQTDLAQIPICAGDSIREGNQDMGIVQLLQLESGGHVLGFRPNDVTIAASNHALRIEFIGANSVIPLNEGAIQNSVSNQNGAKTLNRVIYKELWQGVSLMFERHDSGVYKSTYIVHPSGNDSASSVDHVRLRYNVPVRVTKNGSLILSFDTGQMTESAPVAWQEINGERIPVDVSFCALNEREIGFTAGSHDPQFPLVIDPILS
jgi:hypothetical protein